MSNTSIDINCDLGEGTGNEAAILPFISSVNIACGFHAGNAITMLEVVRLAKKHGVAIGAHPSWEDREHFGRRNMQLPARELYAILLYQLGALAAICHSESIPLHHVKPHGALYNQAATDAELSKVITTAIRDFNPTLILYGLSGSVLNTTAEKAGLRVAAEVFADRTYTKEGLLTPRTMHNAMITETSKATAQALQLVTKQEVTTIDHTLIHLKADTICIHGDGAHAPEFARALHHAMESAAISIQPPAK